MLVVVFTGYMSRFTEKIPSSACTLVKKYAEYLTANNSLRFIVVTTVFDYQFALEKWFNVTEIRDLPRTYLAEKCGGYESDGQIQRDLVCF